MLELHTPLENAGHKIEYVYFPCSVLASVVAKKRWGADAEVSIIGFEGMTGSALVMGDDRATHDGFIQMTSQALAIDASQFKAALDTSETLRPFLMRYVHAFHTSHLHRFDQRAMQNRGTIGSMATDV
ncbi:hypothetical protein [Mesorhizobium caraganae]|uniref:hypothetical protein n=1 Tax=Mesorhizobium caraganae TaxID=483206 RepID=UPI00333A0BE4